MKLLPAHIAQAGAHHDHEHGEHANGQDDENGHAHAHDHAATDGIEWEDDMVEVNKITTPANTRWKLIDRSTDAANHDIAWQFRVGDRVKIRLVNEMDSDHPMHHPFHIHGAGRFLVLARDGEVELEPGVERHGARPNGGDGRHPAGSDQPRPLDGALPHRRAPRERHDVQLRRRRGRGDARDPRRRAATTSSLSGAGRPGLPLGYFLRREGRRFVILEAAAEPAAAWRARWDSLKLFTSARYDSLPGLAFPGDPDSYPGRDEVVEYLTGYAEHFDLPVELGSEVLAVRPGDERLPGGAA